MSVVLVGVKPYPEMMSGLKLVMPALARAYPKTQTQTQ